MAGRYAPSLTWLAPLAILPYHYVSLRRVFGGSPVATAWKGTLLGITYMLVIFSAMVAVGLWSVKASGITPPADTKPPGAARELPAHD